MPPLLIHSNLLLTYPKNGTILILLLPTHTHTKPHANQGWKFPASREDQHHHSLSLTHTHSLSLSLHRHHHIYQLYIVHKISIRRCHQILRDTTNSSSSTHAVSLGKGGVCVYVHMCECMYVYQSSSIMQCQGDGDWSRSGVVDVMAVVLLGNVGVALELLLGAADSTSEA